MFEFNMKYLPLAYKNTPPAGVGTPAGGGGASMRVSKSVDRLNSDQFTKSMKPTDFRYWRQLFYDWYAKAYNRDPMGMDQGSNGGILLSRPFYDCQIHR